MRTAFLAALAAFAVLPAAAQTLPSTDTRAVPTYEAVGLYWSNPGAAAAGCEVRYRRVGDAAFRQGLAMWYDARNNECRGSLVNLAPDTSYEVQFNLPALAPVRALTFRTWPNQRPVAQRITVNSMSGATLNVSQGGSPSGYVVYQGAPGAVIDGLNAVEYNVTINASYVIVRGLVLRNAQRDGIRISPGVTDVIIEDNEITGWGRPRGGGYGVDSDSAIHAVCNNVNLLQRVTIQRNEIHDPRYDTNSWDTAHPAGPQGITFEICGGNHVIRHNEIFSTSGRYYNDGIGGSDNYSTAGFPNADSDIYGNIVQHTRDDGIEAEGGNRNVRIWGNYIDRTATGIASTPTTVGPLYLFRNVYNRSRYYYAVPPDSDSRQPMFKAGSDATLGDGRRYVFHNTMLQAMEAGSIYGLGGSHGISGTGSNRLLNNTYSINNIYHGWRGTWQAYFEPGVGNYFERDMYNGTAGAVVINGINATPVYAPGNGWQSEEGGMYQLSPTSRGYDEGAIIPNFSDGYTGTAPDVGAHEAGTAAMRFGIAGSPGPAAPPPPTAANAVRTDLNGDGRSDILWRNSATGQVYRMLMNGLTITSAGMAYTEPNTAWRIVGDADFNADGITDLLWRNFSTGEVYVMLFNASAMPAGGGLVHVEPSATWQIVQTPDLNGDGRADIVWWNSVTGQVYALIMNGASVLSRGVVYTEPNTAWRIVASGDLSGSGARNQLVWRNVSTGQVFLQTVSVSGSTFSASGVMIYTEPDPAWRILAAADFNGDGKSDLLWRHETSGSVYVMLMNGGTVTAAGQVHVEPNTAWKIVAQGDYNGDGRADLLWRNESTGHVYMMLMSGLTIASQGMVYTEPSGSWRVLGPYEYAQ